MHVFIHFCNLHHRNHICSTYETFFYINYSPLLWYGTQMCSVLSPFWVAWWLLCNHPMLGHIKTENKISLQRGSVSLPLFSPLLVWVKWHGRSVHFDLKECLDHTANTLRELVSSFRPRMLYAILFMWPGNRTPMFLMSLKRSKSTRRCQKAEHKWKSVKYADRKVTFRS